MSGIFGVAMLFPFLGCGASFMVTNLYGQHMDSKLLTAHKIVRGLLLWVMGFGAGASLTLYC